MPEADHVAAMMKYNESLRKAGMLVALLTAFHLALDGRERSRFREW